MFIDNCTAHKDVPSLENIELKYLPPNTTSILQPLDQGIVENFKTLYRKEVVRTVIDTMENGNKHFSAYCNGNGSQSMGRG